MSTPEAEDQVTAADLYRWAGHYEDVDPGHAIELSQSASALEARDERIRGLEAELEEAKARIERLNARRFPNVYELTDAEVIAARAAYTRSYGVLEYGDQTPANQLYDLFADAQDALSAIAAARAAAGEVRDV